jgi:hypothetical protein
MKIARLVLVVAVLVASGIVVSYQEPAKAADRIYVCADLNDPANDGVYNPWYGAGYNSAWAFKAGDTIKLVAEYGGDSIIVKELHSIREGAANGGYQMALWMDEAIVKTASFPGKITYAFATDTNIPAGGGPSLGWDVTYPTLAMLGRAAADNGFAVRWAVSCTPAAEATAQIVPGCDLGMELTPDAAVGAFVWTTDVYWAPDVNATTEITMPAGKTAWVLGMDATGEFYKFVWSCNYLWAPVGTMGPNYDEVWNGTPLPTTVVE